MAASPGGLASATLDRIVEHYGLEERQRLDLPSTMGPDPVGALRVFAGGPVAKVVYIGLTVPPIGLDSHMVYAFTPGDSLAPHFTLDSVMNTMSATGEPAESPFAFHLDLTPKVELATNLAYMDEVFGPLTPVADDLRATPGLSPAHLSMRQYAVMTPWMVVHRATAEAFEQIDKGVTGYLEQWFRCLDDGISAEVAPVDVADRDRRARAVIFSPEVDPVWNNVARLVGDDLATTLRLTLQEA